MRYGQGARYSATSYTGRLPASRPPRPDVTPLKYTHVIQMRTQGEVGLGGTLVPSGPRTSGAIVRLSTHPQGFYLLGTILSDQSHLGGPFLLRHHGYLGWDVTVLFLHFRKVSNVGWFGWGAFLSGRGS